MTHPIGDRFSEVWPEPARVIHASIEIAAPPDVVFNALADPRELVAWLGDARPAEAPNEPSSDDSDAASPSLTPFTYPVGGDGWLAHVRAPDGTPATVSGEFLYVVPPRSLVTTWSASWNGFVQEQVTFELAPIEIAGDAGTRVTVTHRARGTHVLREATRASAPVMGGTLDDTMNTLLARLAAYITMRSLVHPGHPSGSDLAHAFDALHRRVVAIHRGETE
jgi:uncharacterized protein YndB with AHSA1/START domain